MSGHLEEIADCLIRHDEQGQLSCISFSEFKRAFFKDPEFIDALSHITLPLTNFHPQRKLVLCRLLLTQAHLHAALIKTFSSVANDQPQRIHPVDALTAGEWNDFDWRPDDSLPREVAVVIPFQAARSFLTKRLEMDSTGSLDNYQRLNRERTLINGSIVPEDALAPGNESYSHRHERTFPPA